MAEYHNGQLNSPDALTRDAMINNNRASLYDEQAPYVNDFHKAIDRLSGAMILLIIEVDMISRRLGLLQKKHAELDKTVKNMDEAVHRLEFPQL